MGVVLVGPDITGDGVADADITVATSFVTINDAIFTDAVNAGSGTGGYNTFLAIKDQTGGEVPQDFYEAGFNANDTNPLDDTNDEIDPSKTHTVRLSDLVIVTVGTVQYYEFRVDLNENNDAVDTQISLDQFKLYTSTSGAIQSTTQEVNGAPSLFSQNLVYDMDAGQNVSVLLDEANSTGSGTDDYSVLVPISKFAGLDPATTFIYLYAEMGRADGSGDGPSNNWTADGGFEEWNIQNGVTLIGTKFNDLDGDGVKDANEGPVAGVTIFIDADRDGQYDVGERSTTTDINGNYTFYGVARGQEIFIDEVIPTGSTQTTGTHEVVNISKTAVPGSIIVVDPIGNFNPIDLSGRKYLDLNGDGQTVGDGGMGNVTIFIDMDGDAAFDAGELSTTTAADGTWSFSGLSSDVIGKKVYEVLPSGYVQTIGAAGYTIVGDASGLVFANFERFNISGTKVIDTNGDGILQAGETTAHAGVTIFIDQDNDGVLDASELSTTTGLNGSWSFNNLGAGYAGATVRELASGDYITTVGANGIAVTGTSGADQTGLVFANFERFNISGTKVIDTNGDGILQAGETTAHAGVTIFIDQDNDGVLDASELSTTTGLNGSWSFNNLGAGYAGATVRELASGDYITTVGANGIAVTGTSGADQTGLVFANFERFNISGTKVIDTNGDGILQAGETTAHAGVTIFIDQDNDGVLDASELSTTTGLNGSWSFNNLGAGYAGATVRELASGDYITTVGANGIAVTGTSGADQTGLVFANFERFNISGTKVIDTNGDGILQAGETTAHAGVTIFIDQDNDGVLDASELSTTTGLNGSWSFNNLGAGYAGATVRELASGDYITTVGANGIAVTGTSGADQTGLVFANFERFNISGTKVIDTNGDGILQAGETTAHAGVTIFIDQDNDGVLDASELSTTTGLNGSWSFNNLGAGYAGATVRELASGDYITTVGANGIAVTGTSGADQTGLVFANFERFNISGTKVIDTNGDGILQAGETTAHAGVTIFIDQDNDGVLDASELSTTTGLNGSWSFNNLGAGYAGATVRELASGDYITTVGANGIAVTGTSGADQTGLVFANFERFNISGTKVIDTNGDGILQAGETTAHAGVTIFIDQDNDGVLDASELSTTTGLNGSWSFNNLGAGYAGATVRELASGDYITTVGANGIAVTGTSGADQTGLVFANFERFNISGTKVIDTNGDGILQAGETTAHAGVTIFIDQDNDGVLDASELSTTTGLNGSWSFNNLGAGYAGATVRELASGDYITTVGANGIAVTGTSGADQTGLVFANFERFNISGTKVIDTNGDGILQAGETTAHAGVTIFIDQDNDGVLDASELSTTTGLNGSWSFNNLGAGYAGATVRELASGDYITTVGANGIAVTGTSGADQTGLVFANFERFNISGTKVIDTNGDGILQAGETTAHAGVTIFIDQDNDGVLDASELSTTTGLNGSWSFNNLGAGYAGATVRELASGDYITTVGANGIAVTGTSGADQTGLVFANFERFNISGTKVIDTNGDGILQAGETTAHAGVTIFIDQDNDGVLDASELSTTTGLNGSWSFNNLGAGYAGATVRELASGDYITTVGANGIAVTGTSGADQTGLVFANFERFNISGTKVIDTNGDGILQAGETTAHAGVTIFIDQDNDGVLDASELSTTTGLNGSWSFNNLGAGYAGATVRELVSGGYVTTIGADGFTVTGTSGADQTGLVFANFLPAPSIELIKYVSVNSTDGTDGLFVDANNDLGPENVNIGTDVWFKVTLDNTGNVALTGVDVEDINTTTGLPGSTFDLMVDGVLTLDAVNNYGATLSGDANGDGDLDVDEIWTITYYQDFDAGNHINTAYVTTDQGASDNDLARYYSMINEGPGVRTPGFWQNMNNGGQFWDGRADNEKNAGQDCFADGELLYAVDGDGNGVIDPFIDSNNDGVSDNAGLLIGDYNHDGFTGDNPLTLDVIEGPEDTLFISLADARALINASNKQLNSLSGDGKFMLGRDMVATWLNYLAGNEIGGPTDTKSPRHYLDDAIDWMQSFSGTTGNADESFDIFKLAGSPIKTSGSTWKSPQTGIDHSALQLHNALDYYNNTGQTEYGGKYYAHDCDDLDFAKAVHALSLI